MGLVTKPYLPIGEYNKVIIDIQPNARSFRGVNGMKNVTYIKFGENSKVVDYIGEYLTGYQYDGSDFRIGERCCFRVTDADRREIEKCVSDYIPPVAPESEDSFDFGPNVTGKPWVVALQQATLIKCAQIRVGMCPNQEDDKMITRDLLDMASEIMDWVINPMPAQSQSMPLPAQPGQTWEEDGRDPTLPF